MNAPKSQRLEERLLDLHMQGACETDCEFCMEEAEIEYEHELKWKDVDLDDVLFGEHE